MIYQSDLLEVGKHFLHTGTQAKILELGQGFRSILLRDPLRSLKDPPSVSLIVGQGGDHRTRREEVGHELRPAKRARIGHIFKDMSRWLGSAQGS